MDNMHNYMKHIIHCNKSLQKIAQTSYFATAFNIYISIMKLYCIANLKFGETK